MCQLQHFTFCATATHSPVCLPRQKEWCCRKDLPPFNPPRMPVSGMFVVKVFMLLICCVFFAGNSFCQDVITRTDSVRIEANIVNVENNQIRYKLFANPEGPDYLISTSDVLFVEYADGTRRVFNQPIAQQLAAAGQDYETGLGRNIISMSVVDLLYLNATLAYERISASGKFGIRVPLSVGLDPDEEYFGYYKRNRVFGAGIALNLYPFGQSRFNYYLGPQAELSVIKYSTYDYTVYDPDNPGSGL